MITPSFKHLFIRTAAVGMVLAVAAVATPALAAGWYLQNSGTTAFIKSMDFYTSDRAIAVGFNVIQRTLNAGNTWLAVTIPAGLPSTSFYGVEAVSGTDIVYVVGMNGTILRAADGKTFVQQTSGVSVHLYDVVCNSTGTTCVAVGDGGTILKTTNSGTTWTPQTSKTSTRLGGVAAVNQTGTMTLYAVGLSGTIVKSVDGGTTWMLQTSGVSTELMGVSFYDASHGIAVGTAQTILKTENGGTTWTPMSTTFFPAHYIFYDVSYKGANEAMIGVDGGNVLLMTTIGTWVAQTMPDTHNYETVYYGGYNERWAAGVLGSIARYDNIAPVAPTNLHFVSPTNNTTSDTTPTFTWTASSGDGESGLVGYQFQVDGVMTSLGTVTTHTVSPALADGVHTAFVRSIDGEDNISPNVSYTFTVDSQPPTVGTVSPSAATAGVPVTFVVTASDNLNVNGCTLRVDGVDSGAMTFLGGGSFSASYTFASAGGHAVAAACEDNAHTLVVGSAVSVTVASGTTPPPTTPPPTTPPPTTPPPTTPPPTTAVPGALLKFACPSGARVDHPCKAVYFYGADGKRHAFSNDKVYFTWYSDFSGVVTVSQTFLSSLPLGKNITYRPGVKLVKFQTLNTVYAVAARGVLRAVGSEAVAAALYGSAWTGVVDDINDAFFTDYTFGANINSASDYSPTAEASAITSVGANL